MKIESLTKEQKSLLAVYRDKWIKIGLSTEKEDKVKAEDAINRAYKVAGLSPPKKIIWSTSPLAGAIVAALLKNKLAFSKPRDSVWDSVMESVMDSVGDSVGSSVRDSVRDSVWTSVGNSVGDSVWDSVGNSVGDSVWDSVMESVRDSVWDSVWDSVMESVRDSVGDSVRDSVRDSVGNSVFGQHDAGWLSFYSYMLEVLKIKSCERLIPLMDLAKDASWAHPYENICVVSQKHSVCELKNGRIHCETGPSIQYSDGFSIWALNGRKVPEWVVTKNKSEFTKEQILGEKNVEIRQEIIKKIGVDEAIKLLGASVCDSKDFSGSKNFKTHEGRSYDLLEVDFGTGSKRKYLKMKNASIDHYHIEAVHPACNTVDQALGYRMEAIVGSDWKRKNYKYKNPEELT